MEFEFQPTLRGRRVDQAGVNNLRSQKALRKLGAIIVGEQNLSSLDGTFSPHVIFEMTPKGME